MSLACRVEYTGAALKLEKIDLDAIVPRCRERKLFVDVAEARPAPTISSAGIGHSVRWFDRKVLMIAVVLPVSSVASKHVRTQRSNGCRNQRQEHHSSPSIRETICLRIMAAASAGWSETPIDH